MYGPFLEENIMKKSFVKFIMSITLTCALSANHSEARVTKEVAEAALPYLMEAAGIPDDKHSETTKKANQKEFENAKIQAILHMIYTDAGQAEMVKWVKIGKFPQILEEKFKSDNTYKNPEYREATLASLFPCNTDTFTSFANHKSRLGEHILTATAVKATKNIASFLKRFKTETTDEAIILNINQNYSQLPIDILLAKIIFILDICDSRQQINDLLKDLTGNSGLITDPQIQEISKTYTLKGGEYSCRPVSAIAAQTESGKAEGDCVETLYRHLINIIIQDSTNPGTLQYQKLPKDLLEYYQKLTIGDFSEAGRTNISKHNDWRQRLVKIVGKNCASVGSLNNIAKGLRAIAEAAGGKKLSYDEKPNGCQTIKVAMDELSKTIGTDKTFDVELSDRETNDPDWANVKIIINESVHDQLQRTITVGIDERPSSKTEGHAEILSITPHQ